MGKRLFEARLDLLALLCTGKGVAETPASYGDGPSLEDGLIDDLHGEVAVMNRNNFIVRMEATGKRALHKQRPSGG